MNIKAEELLELLTYGEPQAVLDNVEELTDEFRRLINSNAQFAFNLDQCSLRMFIFEDAVNKILSIADESLSVLLHENMARALTQIQHIACRAQTTARGEQ